MLCSADLTLECCLFLNDVLEEIAKYTAKEQVSWFEGRKEDLSVALEEKSAEVATQADGEEDQEFD